jgi:hypothetical protein
MTSLDARQRLIRKLDALQTILLSGIVFGSVAAFGGQVWWFAPLLAVAVGLLAVAWVVRSAAAGRILVLRSPIAAAGALVVALGVAQLAPLPQGLDTRLSARDPAREGPAVVTLDRPATLRWTAGAMACLVVMVVTSQHVDRASRLRMVWGAVLGGFGLATLFGVLQVAAGSGSIYGIFAPGSAPWWGPSEADRLAGPHVAHWRVLSSDRRPPTEWMVPRLEDGFAIGPFVAGPGGLLALASLALPLALGLIAHSVAPRGSREPLLVRARQDDVGAWLMLAVPAYVAGAVLHGYLGGSILTLPAAAGLVLVTLGASWRTGNARLAGALGLIGLAALATGVLLGSRLGRPEGVPWLTAGRHREELIEVWKAAWRVGRDHPVLGVGLGAFGRVVPKVKSFDAASGTAGSAALQWWAESGLAGAAVVAIAFGWIALKIRGSWRRIGQADRALAAGLTGSLASFAAFSMIHWSVQLAAVALAGAALLGTADRWLSGGTDLFLQPT